MTRLHRPIIRSRQLVVALASLLLSAPSAAHAQWLGTSRQSYLRAPHNGAFAERNGTAERLLNAFDYQQATLYETLWRNPAAPSTLLEGPQFSRQATELLTRPPRIAIELRTVAPEFAKLVPETDAMLGWGRMFQRQVLDVLADRSLTTVDRDGRMAELVAYYRSRTNLAVSAQPKSMALLDAQPHSLEFRRRLPTYNGLGWAARWLEAGLYESLMSGGAEGDRSRQQEAMIGRFRQMVQRAPDATPYLLPLTPAVAPTFARRYPDAAAIVDNLHMLEDAIADVLVAREIPRSAKRQEILRVGSLFQSDTASGLTVAEWLQGAEAMGVNNMGGPTTGFPAELPTPTVARGASMAPAPAHDHAAMVARDSMGGMQHGNAQQGQAPTLQTMMAIFERMMADPVIRERAATDPTLQRMLANLPAGTSGMSTMPAMDHANMPGMTMTPATAATMLSGTPEERRRAIEFVVRLLSDPAVEARIHSYPELHVLWSDPEVQKRLQELKRTTPVKPPGGR